MGIASNIRTALAHPAMLPAYIRWRVSQNPMRSRHGHPIGHFPSFGAYYSFDGYFPDDYELEFIRRHALGGPIFDVGANIGGWTACLSDYGHVHSFEPVPSTFARLQANCGELTATLMQTAVLDAVETVRMTSKKDAALNRLDRQGDIAVPSTTIDAYCETQAIDRIDLLKIDVEGAEQLVLRGADRMLRERKIGALIVELCDANLAAMNFTKSDVVSALESHGYRLRALSGFNFSASPLS